jgi:hypothetical protein
MSTMRGSVQNKQYSNNVITIVIAFLLLFTAFSASSFSGGESNDNHIFQFPNGWSYDFNLSPAIGLGDLRNSSAKIVSNGQNVHIVRDGAISWKNEIYYARSIDGGQNWNKNELLTPFDGFSSMFPDIAVNNDSVHVVYENFKYGIRDVIVYKNSTDNGETWGDEILISPNDNYFSQNARIAVSGQNVHVVWEDYRSGNEYNVYYKRSTDGGVTWDDGLGNVGMDRRLTFAVWPTTGDDGSAIISISGNHVHVLFTRVTSNNVRHAMYIHSSDNGATWGSEMEISNDPVSAYPDGITAEGANVHILWTGFKDGNREIYYRSSNDYGNFWNPEQRLTFDPNWSDQHAIAVNGSHVFVTWMDDRDHYDWTGSTSGAFELYCKESFDGGSSWGPDTRLTYAVNNSIQPAVAMDANYIHVAWTDNRTDGARNQVFYKRYPDFPETTPPTHSNETPLPDSFKDAPGTNISVQVTDSSGVNASTIQLWVNGSLVSHTLTPIIDGYNVSWVSGGFGPGTVTCRIVGDDNLGNRLDYTWNFTVLAIYTIPLHVGWNLISLPLEQVDTSIPSVLASISGKWEVVKYYDTLDKADPWKTYRVGSSMNDLAGIDNTMGFWIKINQPNVNLTVRGNIPTYTTIPLYAGWNLVGYPTQITETVGNAMWGTGADRVEVFDSISPYIKEVGPTYIMKPGEGYWIHVPADTIWTIN